MEILQSEGCVRTLDSSLTFAVPEEMKGARTIISLLASGWCLIKLVTFPLGYQGETRPDPSAPSTKPSSGTMLICVSRDQTCSSRFRHYSCKSQIGVTD